MLPYLSIITLLFVGSALSSPPQDKIDGSLLSKLKAGDASTNVIIEFVSSPQPILDEANFMKFSSRGEKIATLKTQLQELATESQQNVIELLRPLSGNVTSFWITNSVFLEKASLDIVERIATLSEVAHIREEIVISIGEPLKATKKSGSSTLLNLEWGIQRIQADKAWDLPGGNRGDNVVISSIDTGVRYTHDALKPRYRDDHGWYDPFSMTSYPEDANGLGTHNMGIMVGQDGMGVAPEAEWIACRACLTSTCWERAVIMCGQFIVCPTYPDGSDPRCDMAPEIVSNSYIYDPWFNNMINFWHSVGIIPFFSIGNNGPSCGSANNPSSVIVVGSTTESEEISTFSSRGPVGGAIFKPDVTAPGDQIKSASYLDDSSRIVASGTAMACSHAAGAAALLKSADPSLTVNEVRYYLQTYAWTSLGPAFPCGGVPTDVFPNHVYGAGRVNIYESLDAIV